MELFQASKQWANRPADERFSSIDEMHNVCLSYKNASKAFYYNLKDMNVVEAPNGKDVLVEGVVDQPINLTHWAFGQLCAKADAPASYLRTLPAELVVRCLNNGLTNLYKSKGQTIFDGDGPADQQVMVYRPEDNPLARSFMSWKYKRIWNADVTERLKILLDMGWRVPPARPAFPDMPGVRPATEDDVLNDAAFSLSIKVGDLIAPAGLYASDHDMFAFLVDPSRPISEGAGEPLYRGMFLSNSEVGAGVIALTTFLYRHVCGNHIVWGASNVKVFRRKHMGEVNTIFDDEFSSWVKQYSNSLESDDIKMIAAAQQTILGDSVEDVVDTILNKRIKVGKRLLTDAFHETERHSEDGNPHSVWGMLNGLTRLSQDTDYADERVKIDIAAGDLMKLVSVN